MALITNLITTALSRLISEEITVWSPRAVRALVKLAVRLLPEAQRARFAEEWQSHVDEVPATVEKFVAAAGFLLAVCRIRLAESHDDDPFFWLDAPLRFRESYWKAFHAVNPIADDERLASDKDLNAVVDTIHRYISESDTLYKESSGKMSVWAEKRRKRQSRNKIINVLANDWGYARLRKIVKPKFDLISRNAEQIVELTDQLLRWRKRKEVSERAKEGNKSWTMRRSPIVRV
jgi:hypothetical protein